MVRTQVLGHYPCAFGERFPGIVVEEAVIFAAPANMGFNFWGKVKNDVIELRINVEELQGALGVNVAPESDWQGFAECVFTLTPR